MPKGVVAIVAVLVVAVLWLVVSPLRSLLNMTKSVEPTLFARRSSQARMRINLHATRNVVLDIGTDEAHNICRVLHVFFV